MYLRWNLPSPAADPDEGGAQRVCAEFGATAFIGDSEEIWAGADPHEWRCHCGEDTAELGVAFALRSTGEVRWITVGERCSACGSLGAFVDWSVDDAPTSHLFEMP